MTKHTPAPWKVTEQGNIYHRPPMRPNEFIPHIGIGQLYGPTVNPNANMDARLVAAAPELLDTCEALAAFTRDLLKLVTPEQIKAARLTTRMLKLNDQAYNAIAKARGEL